MSTRMNEPIEADPAGAVVRLPVLVAVECVAVAVRTLTTSTTIGSPDGETFSISTKEDNGDEQPHGNLSSCSGDTSSSHETAGMIRENANIYKTAFHIFKANVGTGVFLLPIFYQGAGYILGPVIALLTGACVIDASQLLLRSKLVINQPRVDTYSRICRFVFGPPVQWTLFVCLLLSQFGFCLLYVQLTVDTMNMMVKFSGSTYVWSFVMFTIEFACTCFSGNFSALAVASITATLAVSFTLVVTFVYICMEIDANGGPHSTVSGFGNNIPIGWFGNMAGNMMVLEGIAIVLPAHTGCSQKSRFKPMLSVALAVTVVIYLLYGLTGYLAYGTSIAVSVVDGLSESKLTTAVRVMLIVNLVCTYPVQFQSAIQAVDQLVGCRALSLKGISLRLFINLLIVAIELIIGPKAVQAVVHFIGALPATVMVFILPALLTLQVDFAVANPEEDRVTLRYWKRIFTESSLLPWRRFCCFCYILFGLLVMVMGTYDAVSSLQEQAE
uniref:Putative amino acid transporter n=1 Tax=Trypanosoma congolense (strain IL3000) TaxID=1068625 RepID=G0USE1_TRYCI|nr:putative amino acid transporter [Trypanosoma congolense IL3000]